MKQVVTSTQHVASLTDKGGSFISKGERQRLPEGICRGSRRQTKGEKKNTDGHLLIRANQIFSLGLFIDV